MRKALLLTLVAMFAMAATASASSVSFSWGSSFEAFAAPADTYSDYNIISCNGTSAHLAWTADDMTYGVLNQNLTVVDTDDDVDPLTIVEITVDKNLTNSVSVGLGIGTFNDIYGDVFEYGSVPVVDVRGTIHLLSGKGEKVNASLDFDVDARFGRDLDAHSLNGVISTLSVSIGL